MWSYYFENVSGNALHLPEHPKSLSSLKPCSDLTAPATVEGTARLKFLLIILFQAYLVPFIYTRKRYIAPGLPGERSEAIGASCTHKSYPHVAYESRAGGAADHDILKFNKLIQKLDMVFEREAVEKFMIHVAQPERHTPGTDGEKGSRYSRPPRGMPLH